MKDKVSRGYTEARRRMEGKTKDQKMRLFNRKDVRILRDEGDGNVKWMCLATTTSECVGKPKQMHKSTSSTR